MLSSFYQNVLYYPPVWQEKWLLEIGGMFKDSFLPSSVSQDQPAREPMAVHSIIPS